LRKISRSYTAREYAYFIGFLRSSLPWFCNSNGPRKRVLWGNAAPFPVVNIICGHWIRDVYRLRQPAGAQAAIRPPIPSRKYFRGASYQGWRRHACWLERWFAVLTHHRVRWRGSKGGLFFVDRRKLLAARLSRMKRHGLADEAIAAL